MRGAFDLAKWRRSRSSVLDKTLSTAVASRDIASLGYNLRVGRQSTYWCEWGLQRQLKYFGNGQKPAKETEGLRNYTHTKFQILRWKIHRVIYNKLNRVRDSSCKLLDPSLIKVGMQHSAFFFMSSLIKQENICVTALRLSYANTRAASVFPSRFATRLAIAGARSSGEELP